MSDFIKNLEIKNFKSIKYLQMDCKRVNVFIGKPNVGKSNILEGLSLLCGGNSFNHEKFLSEFIRYNSAIDLFHDKNHLKLIEVSTDKIYAFLRFHNNSIGKYDFMIGENWIKDFMNLKSDYSVQKLRQEFEEVAEKSSNSKYIMPNYITFDKNGGSISKTKEESLSIVRKYEFKKLENLNSPFSMFLNSPFGNNLFTIFFQEKKLRKEIVNTLKEYGLELVYNSTSGEYIIQKNIEGDVTQFSYSTMADTFQRLFFHLAAIESNKNAVLLFEEPEAHSYPPYIWQLANRIAHDKDNQYFISTHSPYIIETLLQEMKDIDINICVTSFENYETKVNVLQADALQDMFDMGADTVFFNMEKFETHTL
jgi:AAA15 family ATPase/GTPase